MCPRHNKHIQYNVNSKLRHTHVDAHLNRRSLTRVQVGQKSMYHPRILSPSGYWLPIERSASHVLGTANAKRTRNCASIGESWYIFIMVGAITPVGKHVLLFHAMMSSWYLSRISSYCQEFTIFEATQGEHAGILLGSWTGSSIRSIKKSILVVAQGE
jgi:hypothetical protein